MLMGDGQPGKKIEKIHFAEILNFLFLIGNKIFLFLRFEIKEAIISSKEK